ncbi:hypothetical protein M9H77_14378 [Catharanthus roseus]|uniref:Uncharacterized protein n=1 Tax=Catharanthus roseus TaxID=4058 RepID=A0ACC0BMV9_CATRO|nr:hypothetical protein M9H77_14378 [Catharanthus roseus]
MVGLSWRVGFDRVKKFPGRPPRLPVALPLLLSLPAFSVFLSLADLFLQLCMSLGVFRERVSREKRERNREGGLPVTLVTAEADSEGAISDLPFAYSRRLDVALPLLGDHLSARVFICGACFSSTSGIRAAIRLIGADINQQSFGSEEDLPIEFIIIASVRLAVVPLLFQFFYFGLPPVLCSLCVSLFCLIKTKPNQTN